MQQKTVTRRLLGSPHHLRAAALDQKPVNGLTHRFYSYPARFSPAFAKASIEGYSKPGDVVLDPFMGGGTTIVEALVCGRRAIGSDINSLAVFLTGVKVRELTHDEQYAVLRWAAGTVAELSCNLHAAASDSTACQPRNLAHPRVRWLRKTISLCLRSIEAELPTPASKRFARCVVLNTGQWALNGRRRIPTAGEFRTRISETTLEMISGLRELGNALASLPARSTRPLIRETDAEIIDQDHVIAKAAPVDLVVTSPPYPGIHMLYHRWQVDGRKETDAPYWITGCKDGDGAAFYGFSDHRATDRYFNKALRSFSAVRRVTRRGGVMIQIIAFSDPRRQLPRYLRIMQRAGFRESRERGQRRIWRPVPGRRWHAKLKGPLPSSREVVLVHVAE